MVYVKTDLKAPFGDEIENLDKNINIYTPDKYFGSLIEEQQHMKSKKLKKQKKNCKCGGK